MSRRKKFFKGQGNEGKYIPSLQKIGVNLPKDDIKYIEINGELKPLITESGIYKLAMDCPENDIGNIVKENIAREIIVEIAHNGFYAVDKGLYNILKPIADNYTSAAKPDYRIQLNDLIFDGGESIADETE